jgi:F0F1-type ATP synthase assembly protein I
MVLDLIIAVVHDAANPLIVKPPLGLVVFLIIGLAIALLADATAFRLSWKSN